MNLGRGGLWLAWTPILVLCTMFACWPLEALRMEAPQKMERTIEPRQAAALNGAAFRVPLWVADPTPADSVPSTPPPPPPPLKLQLLAILREGGVYKAVVYDPDTDRIQTVAVGDKVGRRTVDSVESAAFSLVDETGRRTLSLKEGS